jgi:hypothetical protein
MQKFSPLAIGNSPKSSYSLSPIACVQVLEYIRRIGTKGVNQFMNNVKILLLHVAFILGVYFATAGSVHADAIMPNFGAAIQGVDYFSFDRVASDGANHNRTHARLVWGRSFGDIADGADPAILSQWISATRPAVLMSASAGSEKHAKSSALTEEDAKNVEKTDVADSTDSAILSAETGSATVGFAGAGPGMGAGVGGWNFNPWFGGLPVPGFSAATATSAGNFVTDADPTVATPTLGESDDPTSAAVPEAGSCFLLGFGLIMVTIIGLRYRRYHPI